MGNGAREWQVEGELVKPVESAPADRISRRAALGALAVLAWEARALAQTPPGGAAPTMPAAGGPAPGGGAGAPDWPRVVKTGETTISFYLPQLDSWDGRLLEAHSAVSIEASATTPPVFGVASVAADTQVDKGARQVTLENIRIEKVHFPSATSQEAAYKKLLQQHVPPRVRTIELDRLETALSMREQQEKGESKPFKNDPPRIVFSTIPAILILIDGEPKYQPVPGATYARVVNTPPLLLKDAVRHPLPPALRRLDDGQGRHGTVERRQHDAGWRARQAHGEACRRRAPSISSPSSIRRTRRAGPRWPRDPSRPSWWHPSPPS